MFFYIYDLKYNCRTNQNGSIACYRCNRICRRLERELELERKLKLSGGSYARSPQVQCVYAPSRLFVLSIVA